MTTMNLARTNSQPSRFVDQTHISTLNEWYKAVQSGLTHNRASVEIEYGRQPSVVNLDADGFGMYPYVPCLGILMEKRGPEGNQIGVEFVNGTIPLLSDTLIFWR